MSAFSTSWVLTLWQFLTEPAKAIHEPDQRRQARLLSAMLAFFCLADVMSWLVTLATDDSPLSAVGVEIYAASLIIVVLLYLFSRTKYVYTAAFLTVSLLSLIIVIAYVVNPSTAATTLYYLTVTILLSALLLPMRVAAIMTLVDLVAVQLIPHLMPNTDGITNVTVFLGIVAGTIFVFIYFRNLFEADRRAELTKMNHELMLASALANESTRLKSEFLATMSHELRTPLNAMLGFSSILLHGMAGQIDDKARELVDRIESNSQRLLSLINDVLDLSKIESGRLEIASVPIQPRKLVETWYAQMSVLAESKGLIFKTEIDPTLPRKLYGDPDRIGQVAINLLSNAFKFTEKGTIKLTVKKADNTWLIEVSDTGIGLSQETLTYIFDEFRQVDGSSKRVYGGSGLGLSIVRSLSQLMGGSVQVSSTLGVGSTFTVVLPLKPVAEEAIVA